MTEKHSEAVKDLWQASDPTRPVDSLFNKYFTCLKFYIVSISFASLKTVAAIHNF